MRTSPPTHTILLAAALAATLAACTPPTTTPPQTAATPTPDHQTDSQSLLQFRFGNASLGCTTHDCAKAWSHARPTLAAHYDASEWRPLALQVIAINYSQDLGYFYLGRAAEALGARTAAAKYYKQAQALATGPDPAARCAATPDGCAGLSLLTEILTREQIVEAQRARAYAQRHQSHAEPAKPGQPDTPAPDNWVDPPPAQ